MAEARIAKGTHSVDTFLDWVDKTDEIPFHLKIHLKKRVRECADQASTLGTPVVLPFNRGKDIVLAMRFFGDGTMEVGWPADAKYITMPGKEGPILAPPPEKEI